MPKIRLLAAALVLAGVAVATPALAATAPTRVDLRVLVISDGSPNVDAIVAQLDRETVPYTMMQLANHPAISAATLSDTVGGVRHAKYQGVVVPNEKALTGDEAAALDAFRTDFGIRRIIAYTYPAGTTWSGTLDGGQLNVTDAAKADGFGYLKGGIDIDDRDPGVSESYGYLSAGSGFTPLVTATAPGGATGAVLAVSGNDLVVSMAMNRFQTHGMVLGHGLVQWLTKGVHLGHWRNWFSVHVDDVLLPDDRWHSEANCTVGDGCNVARDPAAYPYNTTIRMTDGDVDALLAWQRSRGLKLDLAFNGEGSVDGDPLTAKLLANKGQLRWLNHTYSHHYLGCVQNFAVVPWQCATDSTGATAWVSQAEITAQIRDNVTWARDRGVSLNAAELVTGEHSGLKSLPQMPDDNPNLAPALSATGVKVIASDASREPASRPVGPAATERRWPMNIYYNVATAAEEVDEYNWIYTRRADGGSGICEDNPATSTCIAPLSTATGFQQYIVPIETRIAFDHIVSTDPAPHYAHQSNLTEDRVLYPVLNSVLDRYQATFTTATPVVNARFADVAQQHRRQAAWRNAVASGKVEAYTLDGVLTIVNRTAGSLDIPVTVPTGTRTVTLSQFGEAYGAERSTWKTVGSGGRLLLLLPS